MTLRRVDSQFITLTGLCAGKGNEGARQSCIHARLHNNFERISFLLTGACAAREQLVLKLLYVFRV